MILASHGKLLFLILLTIGNVVILEIVLPVPLHRRFDYCLPEGATITDWPVGVRVKVPFGKRARLGIIVAHKSTSDVPTAQLKTVLELVDKEPLWSTALWSLLLWAARYYRHPLGDALFHTLPTLLRKGESTTPEHRQRFQLTSAGEQAMVDTANRAHRQQQLLARLADAPKSWLELRDTDATLATWRRLQEKGLIEPATEEQPTSLPAAQIQLNSEQALASQRIQQQLNAFQPYLLDGITGSGKTEVYLDVIDKVVANGQQALVLIPEIGLTPQTLRRFTRRFGDQVAALHSGLSDGERYHTWLDARAGRIKVLIGTRSAVFTPFADLGLIVVDEEHDTSYKQQEGFRYHGRDLAVLRAQRQHIPVILGSATPSLESLANVHNQKYQLLTLRQRALTGSSLKRGLIDMRSQAMNGPFSQPLLAQIRYQLEQGHQVLVFLNRRGYAPVMLCHECGWLSECPRCDRPYTLHQQERRLRCHSCDGERALPEQCPECGSTQLVAVGHGTEQLEERLSECFPDINIARIDRDSTRRKEAFADYVAGIHSGHYQLLVGTQILAKGHDFPNLALVAVVDADGALYSNDFRAGERLAQLMTQVAGRAGRAQIPGELLIQTHHPEHPWLHSLVSVDYEQMAQQLLSEREMAGLPPYSAMALLRVDAHQSYLCEQFMQTINSWLQHQQPPQVQWLAPEPASHIRKAGRWRMSMVLRSQQRSALQHAMDQLLPELTRQGDQFKVRWHLDVDPIDSH